MADEQPAVIKGLNKVRKCSCVHEFQDKRYGKGKRVHTYSSKDDEYRCTVCGLAKTT